MRLAGLAVLALLAPTPSMAGAWSQASGETQVIVKLERMRATEAFDADGARQPMPGEREDDLISVFAEHGLTDRLTLQAKSEWQSGFDAGLTYEGLGPTEIGLRYQVWRNERFAVSVYGGYAIAGEARNAGYAPPGAGEGDWEARVLAGYGGPMRWLRIEDGFVEVQAARRFRTGLPDEDRLDLTLGANHGPNWQVLTQVFSGRALEGSEAAWVNAEVSIVRRLGAWSLQAGWRQAVAGRQSPAQQGLILAVWRRF